MKVEGKLLIRSDGVRLLLSPYRQQLADGKGSVKRIQAQVQALSKETLLAFGTVRTLRDGSAEALLGAEHDCYPAGELVHEAVGGVERLFFAEEIASNAFVVIVVDDRRVVLDEIANSEDDLVSRFEAATSQFGDRPYTLAVAQSIFDVLPSRGLATPNVLEVSAIDTAVVLSTLKFRAVHQIGSQSMSAGGKRQLAIAAAVSVIALGGWYWWDGMQDEAVAQEMALLAAMKNRAIDPLGDYKRSMSGVSADVFIDEIDTLIGLASNGRGWIPSRIDYENGQPLQISFSSFGGTRQQLVADVRIRDGVYAQGPKGTQMLIDISQHPGRKTVPQIEPLSKVLFETLDALDENSMGVMKIQVGEIASFGGWSSQKVQINVENAPLPLIKLLSNALKDRPINVTQTELSLENQALSGVIHLDVFGS